jgi:hypothetical protein
MSQLAREFFKFRHQTICVEIIIIINSQITKARDINHINSNLFNSFTTADTQQWLHSIMFEKRKVKIISKLVGISEAIRLILIYLYLKYFAIYLGLFSVLFSLFKFILTYYIVNIMYTAFFFTLNKEIETDELYNSRAAAPCIIEVEHDIVNKSTGHDSLKFNE